MKTLHTDIVIIGGGITGLWTLHRLRQRGVNAVLVTDKGVGAGQTICAQGIIHSGLKYALQGKLNKSASTIADMPQYWQQCLQGDGDIDLCNAKINSSCQYLWTDTSLRARFTGLMASQAVKSLCEKVKSVDYPACFQFSNFKGDVYRLHEPVLDVPSVLHALLAPYRDAVITATVQPENIEVDGDGQWQQMKVSTTVGDSLLLKANYFVLAAGNGNADFLTKVNDTPKMQQRPLHMVSVRSHTDLPCYAHYVDSHINPRVTITSHGEGANTVWYLGGELAERGVQRDAKAQISYANELMQGLFPTLNWSNASWHTFTIQRAEVFNKGKRPEGPYVKAFNNVIVTWPTKLAFAPVVAQQIVGLIKVPTETQHENPTNLTDYTKPALATLPWV